MILDLMVVEMRGFKPLTSDLWACPGRAPGLLPAGKTADNASIESFHSRFRQECLNEHWFLSLEYATEKIGAWRLHYNEQRPHRSLEYQS